MQEKVQNISPIKQRILSYVDILNISKREFYSEIGVSRGTLESKTGITEDILAKFIARYPLVSTDWLINGSGPMLKTHHTHEHVESRVDEPISPFKAIPHLPISAEAGAFNGDVSVGERDCSYYIVPSLQGADFMITVRGDSMSPSFMPGDIIACKRIENESYIQWGRVYLLDTDQGPIVKRVKPSNKDGTVLITSDNPDYASFDLEQKSIRKMALVLGLIRPE